MMTPTCLFYRNEPRREAGSDTPIGALATRWCALPNRSPVPETLAKSVIGAERLLRCGGKMDVCPVFQNSYPQFTEGMAK